MSNSDSGGKTPTDATDAQPAITPLDLRNRITDRAELNDTVICAIDHRLSFGDGENSAPFASHVVVFGESTPDLEAELREHGTLLRPEVDQ